MHSVIVRTPAELAQAIRAEASPPVSSEFIDSFAPFFFEWAQATGWSQKYGWKATACAIAHRMDAWVMHKEMNDGYIPF